MACLLRFARQLQHHCAAAFAARIAICGCVEGEAAPGGGEHSRLAEADVPGSKRLAGCGWMWLVDFASPSGFCWLVRWLVGRSVGRLSVCWEADCWVQVDLQSRSN